MALEACILQHEAHHDNLAPDHAVRDIVKLHGRTGQLDNGCQACQCSALSDLGHCKTEAHQAVGHQDCGDGQKYAHDNRDHDDCNLPTGAPAATACLGRLRLPGGLLRRRRGHRCPALQALHRGGAARSGRLGRAA